MRRAAVLILAAAPMLAIGAAAQDEPAPADAGSGALLATFRGTTISLPLASMEVSLAVSGPLVHGAVTQEFTNPTDAALDAVYVFPLPEGAAVDGVELEVDGRRFAGEIREKEDARRTGAPHPPWSWADMVPIARLTVPRLGIERAVRTG